MLVSAFATTNFFSLPIHSAPVVVEEEKSPSSPRLHTYVLDESSRSSESRVATSIRAKADGQERKIQKTFWDSGLLLGIYYTFAYVFSLSRAKKEVFDEIYAQVKLAVEGKKEIVLAGLCATLFQENKKNATLACFEENFDMLQHALGYDTQAEKLLLLLHKKEIEKNNHNNGFTKKILKDLAGVTYFQEAVVSLLPWTPKENPRAEYAVYTLLTQFVANAKMHSLYQEFTNPLAETEEKRGQELLKKIIDLLKEEQLKQVRGDVQAEDRQAVEHLHATLHIYFEIYKVNSQYVLDLVSLVARFPELTAKNFKNFALHMTEREARVRKAFTSLSEQDLTRVFGLDRYKKVQAMLAWKEKQDLQILRALHEVLKFFLSLQQDKVTLDEATRFFNDFEIEIKVPEWHLQPGFGPGYIIAEACFSGAAVLRAYFGQDIWQKIEKELVYWIAMAHQPRGSIMWDQRAIGEQIAYLTPWFSHSTIKAALERRAEDFKGMWSRENYDNVFRYLTL